MKTIKIGLNKYGANKDNKILVLKALRTILHIDIREAKTHYDNMGHGTVIIEATDYQILYLKQSSLFIIDEISDVKQDKHNI